MRVGAIQNEDVWNAISQRLTIANIKIAVIFPVGSVTNDELTAIGADTVCTAILAVKLNRMVIVLPSTCSSHAIVFFF